MNWDGQERRGEAHEMRDLLIRIDERTNRMDTAMFGENGMDKRLRHLEQDNAAAKAKSAVLAAVISVFITVVGIFIGKR